MTTTLHGHYIPYSERTKEDEFAITRAKKCGGVIDCSDCKTEAEEWRDKYLAGRMEENDIAVSDGTIIKFPKIHPVEEAKMRHPSSNKKKSHRWFDSLGNPVVAWRVGEFIAYFMMSDRFPPEFDGHTTWMEVSANGLLQQLHSDREVFRTFKDNEWLVVGADDGLAVYQDDNFRANFYHEDDEVPPAVQEKEMVNHPAHYGGADNPYEVIKVIEAWELDFHLGSAVKYIPRAGKKDPELEIQDLEKSVFYINRKIELLREKVKKNG